MSKVFVSWSGGKDCSLACHRAVSQGLKVRYLVNMVTPDGQKSWSHGLSASVLKAQARAMGIALVQRATSSENYESTFIDMLRHFKEEGIESGIFGDIDFNEHRKWVENVCHKAGMTARLPLWAESQESLLQEFISIGFEATIVATKADLLGEEWVGRKIDASFVRDLNELRKTKEITPCGEAGEYHTIVTNGPLFKRPLKILSARKVLQGEHWFLEIDEAK